MKKSYHIYFIMALFLFLSLLIPTQLILSGPQNGTKAGRLDFTLKEQKWFDASLNNGLKNQNDYQLYIPLTDIDDFRISPGDTLISQFTLNAELVGKYALADVGVVMTDRNSIPEVIELDYKINDSEWININDSIPILFYHSLPQNDKKITNNGYTPVELKGKDSSIIVGLRIYYEKDSTNSDSMQETINLRSLVFYPFTIKSEV